MEAFDRKVKQAIDELQDSNVKYRKVIQAGISKWIKDYQEGRIQINTVADLKKLIEMDIQLQKDELFLMKTNQKLYDKDKFK
ncbi:hypothetical protein VQL36_19405 [Chengkuizengella sp. SCS-71B]|uniref:hypothetical protein n=1 Tax=Chengkuizengella sp. SCS-71B TaxID=3115290 RepID=UPI0032C22C80